MLDQLLDDWEEFIATNSDATLDDFLETKKFRIEPRLLVELRKQVDQLRKIDSQIGQFCVGSHEPVASRSLENDEFEALKKGMEPIAGYHLTSQLGSGGFGSVWKAKSPGGFHVALKFVRMEGREGDVELRSLDVIKDVRHPNLLSVFGAWKVEPWLVIATELADRSLDDRLREAQKEGHAGIPAKELNSYMEEAAKGIDALNDASGSGRPRIQHRDIKPQNILLSGGSVKVGDFGLAREIQYDVTGHTGSMTFAYAAPECFDGTTSTRSDQYSLAVTYCQLKGGQLPFEGTQVEVMEGHRKKKPNLSMIPESERWVIERALAKRPKDRWKSCSQFVSQLSNASLSTSTTSKAAISPSQPLLLLGASLMILLGVGGWLMMQESTRSSAGNSGAQHRQIPTPVNNTSKDTIAVLYFENQANEPGHSDPLAKGLCSMMVSHLSVDGDSEIVERDRIEEVIAELKLSQSDLFEMSIAPKIGKLIGAKRLMLGSYFQHGETFRIDARIVEVETGLTLSAAGVEGKPEEFSLLLQKLAAKIVGKTASADVDFSIMPGISAETCREFGIAFDKFDEGKVDEAISIIGKIVDEHPKFGQAQELLKTWERRNER